MSQKFQINHNYSYQPSLFWIKTVQAHTSFLFSFILFFAYAIIFLIGFIANILVIVIIIKRRHLITTLICLPPTVYPYYDKRWIFGEFLCRFVPFMQVSIDRFIAIHKPIHSKLLCTPIRVLITVAFVIMIPLILHHRIVDPFEIILTACAEDWDQNMNARLAYGFILLFVLFILPLTLMTYCYVHISFSLWFIDSNVQTPLSSTTTNAARCSTISEDFPIDIRTNSAQILDH
ncbi:unnamed protein product [Rotaria socialis]|nr:unnamed protein product [Rotaria socialis]